MAKSKGRFLGEILGSDGKIEKSKTDAAITAGANLSLAADGTLTTTTLPLSGGTLTGNLNLGDNVKAQFGAGNDLQIYHSGTHSYIKDAGTGNLNILASTSINLLNGDSSDYMARFSDNGSNQFFYDGSQKLATTSTGIDVTGDITSSGDGFFNGTKLEGDSKEILRFNDSWLRLNPANEFTSGIYCGTGILRTDGHFQVGAGGSKFSVSGANGNVTVAGNLLVGKTVSNIATDGIELGTRVESTADGTYALRLNRRSSDGDIAQFRKDGAVIGNIGSTSGSMYIEGNPATGKSGLTFYGAYIEPRDNGSPADNAIDLGSTANRFHDAHFGGTVNVGENLVVTGNLTINGTTTTLNTATLNVEDKNITLNYGSGDTSSTADGAGITIQDAVNSSTDASFTWRASDDKFISSHPIRAFGGFELPDGNKLIAGDSSDLQFFHDGSNSYIQHGTTGNFNLTLKGGTEYALVAVNDGAVTLFHNGSAKIATASGGASVTGALSVSGNLSTGFFEIGDDSTTTTATTQVAIAAFAASSVRSCKLIVQATNTTDSTYHFTEVSIIHDGTDTYMTEYGTMFTGAAAEAAFTSDISSGSVRLLATPASTDSITFKVVRQMITV